MDPASTFLMSPPLGNFPDSSISIGTCFETGGAHESWGYTVVRRPYKGTPERLGEGRTLEQAIEHATQTLISEQIKT